MNLATWQQQKKRVASARDKLENDATLRGMLDVLEAEHPRWIGAPKWSAQGAVVTADDRSYMLGLIHGADYLLTVLKRTGELPPPSPKDVPATFQPPTE